MAILKLHIDSLTCGDDCGRVNGDGYGYDYSVHGHLAPGDGYGFGYLHSANGDHGDGDGFGVGFRTGDGAGHEHDGYRAGNGSGSPLVPSNPSDF